MIVWPIKVTRTKYLTWYEDLVAKAKDRPLLDGYVEHHHVVPVSLGGSNEPENIITLTAREHYIAHLLLWRITMDKKFHNKMSMALHVMVNGSGHKKQDRNYLIPSRIYESARRSFIQAMKAYFEEHGGTMKGKKHTPEALAKMRAWQAVPEIKQKQRERVLGEKNHMYGKLHSDETKKQISAAVAATWTDEDKEAKSIWAKEKWQDPEYKKTMSDARKTSEGWLNRDWKAIARKAADVKMARGWKPSKESKKKSSETRKAKIASGEIVPWNRGKKCDHLSGENSSNFTTYQITDPSGNVFEIKTRQNVSEFCKEQNIGYWSLLDLASGKQGKNHLHLAGWKATKHAR
jgi:hypothetical protein